MANGLLDQSASDLRNTFEGAERPTGTAEAQIVDLIVTPGAGPDGEQAIYLTVVLSAPPEGQETWPLEAVLAVRDMMWEKVRQVDPEYPVYISVTPATAD